MRVYYFFDETDSVASVAVMFPYEERQKLLGILTLSFGPYQGRITKGISTIYMWPADDGTTLSVEETLDPKLGILALGIGGPNGGLLKKTSSDCNRQPVPQRAATLGTGRPH